MTQETQTKKPDLFIFAKISTDGNSDRIGPRIGVGFFHKEGDGFNIILDAQPFPIKGRVQLVAFPPQEHE